MGKFMWAHAVPTVGTVGGYVDPVLGAGRAFTDDFGSLVLPQKLQDHRWQLHAKRRRLARARHLSRYWVSRVSQKKKTGAISQK
mmetsp:Transcript_22850/g.36357  ORF Transcript_22850/g.36357 Transcript_22850/m.36357 type:complete len:84 (+) Transcript_22850:229-480(+)